MASSEVTEVSEVLLTPFDDHGVDHVVGGDHDHLGGVTDHGAGLLSEQDDHHNGEKVSEKAKAKTN